MCLQLPLKLVFADTEAMLVPFVNYVGLVLVGIHEYIRNYGEMVANSDAHLADKDDDDDESGPIARTSKAGGNYRCERVVWMLCNKLAKGCVQGRQARDFGQHVRAAGVLPRHLWPHPHPRVHQLCWLWPVSRCDSSVIG